MHYFMLILYHFVNYSLKNTTFAPSKNDYAKH